MFVFDSSPLIVLFRHFYPDRFPTLWENFSALISSGKAFSVREVENEIKRYGSENRLTDWAITNRDFFSKPTHSELLFVTEIFKVKHFQALIRKKERLQGKPVADPFVIAKAKVDGFTVVTQETFKKNSAQIPNVCEHFKVPCINLEIFMEKQEWTF